ncbi:MAG: hypothetical protein ACOC9Q_01525 [bacterium]
MSYFQELEEVWWRRRRSRYGRRKQRPSGLRGPDFVGELLRLAVATQDKRFDDAAKALLDHGIIDKDLNFARWQRPSIQEADGILDLAYTNVISTKITFGASIWHACAETAAEFGTEGASFETAVKRLQLLYSRLGK